MPSALELIEGQVFAGQFRVVKPLAQGGMGAVYVVEQLSTGKKRALKLMLPSAAVVDGTRRFEQEARTSSLIPSEHVVDVIAAGIEGPERIPWLAMELLEGESLEDYLEQMGALSANQAYEILSQLAHALSAAHDLGVVHRDLKPDNIFLARSRTSSSECMVKVLDFGLATVVEPTTKNTTALGSPLWMAPEQTQTNEPITLGTDIWAIGLIVFRMLSGRYYWRGTDGSLVSLMREVVLDPLPSASQRSREAGGAELPAGFDEWFGQCVVRFAAYRFDHARDAWQALHTVLVNAGATPQAPRSLSQRPRTEPPRTEPPAAAQNSAGATALSSSKTMLSGSDADLRPSRVGSRRRATFALAPEKSGRRAALVFGVLLVATAAGAAYWLKSGKFSGEASTAFADLPAAPPARATASGFVAPVVSPANSASASSAPSAAPASASSASPSASASLVHSAKAVAAKPVLQTRPAHSGAQPEKPPSALPDLL